MTSMDCPVKSQSQGLTFHKTWNVVKEKPSRSGQSNLFSFYIPLIWSCFSLLLLVFFYSFLSRFVFALVQSSPTANDDLCWRFCCCHTKLVHSGRLRHFRYYFFCVNFEIRALQDITSSSEVWQIFKIRTVGETRLFFPDTFSIFSTLIF